MTINELLKPTSMNGNGKRQQKIYNDTVIAEVRQTYDYARFKRIGENREFDQTNLRRLRESFKEAGLMWTCIVNEHFEIIDANHRFEINKELGLPINYIMCTGYGINEVQIYNTTGKLWTRKDHMHREVVKGTEAYVTAKDFMKEFPELNFSICVSLLAGTSSGVKQGTIDGKKLSIKDFEKGLFEIKDLAFAIKAANQLMDFKDYFEKFNNKTFVKAVVPLFRLKIYDHRRMVQKLKVSSIRLVPQGTIDQYRFNLQKIYNWKCDDNNKADFINV